MTIQGYPSDHPAIVAIMVYFSFNLLPIIDSAQVHHCFCCKCSARGLRTSEEIIQTDNVVALLQQPIYRVRTEKSGSAGDMDTFAHDGCCKRLFATAKRLSGLRAASMGIPRYSPIKSGSWQNIPAQRVRLSSVLQRDKPDKNSMCNLKEENLAISIFFQIFPSRQRKTQSRNPGPCQTGWTGLACEPMTLTPFTHPNRSSDRSKAGFQGVSGATCIQESALTITDLESEPWAGFEPAVEDLQIGFSLQPYEVLYLEWAAAEAPAERRGILHGKAPSSLEANLAAKTRSS
jgi:hypothetical protein